MQRLSSSLRSRSPEAAMPMAEALAKTRGISRVVDTTRLDVIGIPVYASIRPQAQGTLCVHAGKGFTHAEARIGALMEAIEFSFAVPGASRVIWSTGSPRSVLSSFSPNFPFHEFCIRLGRSASQTDVIGIVEARDLAQLRDVVVPAELVFMPFSDPTSASLFGASTNGLASGNDLEEATVHALAEVMERHVASFETLGSNSASVRTDSAPPTVRSLCELIRVAGLEYHLRYVENEFKLPFFSAYIFDPDQDSTLSIANGSGFHPVSEIAAVRALCEAAQSRLTAIHGGRDDLIQRFETMSQLGREAERNALIKRRSEVSTRKTELDFSDVPDLSFYVDSIDDAFSHLMSALERAGMHSVARVVFTEPCDAFQVVRIIVPGAEMYEEKLKRVGPRLLRRFA